MEKYYIEVWIEKTIQTYEKIKYDLEKSYSFFLKNILLKKKEKFNFSFKMPLLSLSGRVLLGEDIIPENKLKEKTFLFSQGTITGKFSIDEKFTIKEALDTIEKNIKYLEKFKQNLKNPIINYGEITRYLYK